MVDFEIDCIWVLFQSTTRSAMFLLPQSDERPVHSERRFPPQIVHIDTISIFSRPDPKLRIESMLTCSIKTVFMFSLYRQWITPRRVSRFTSISQSLAWTPIFMVIPYSSVKQLSKLTREQKSCYFTFNFIQTRHISVFLWKWATEKICCNYDCSYQFSPFLEKQCPFFSTGTETFIIRGWVGA